MKKKKHQIMVTIHRGKTIIVFETSQTAFKNNMKTNHIITAIENNTITSTIPTTAIIKEIEN